MSRATLSPVLALWAFKQAMALVLAGRMLQSLWALYIFTYHYQVVLRQIDLLRKSGKI